MAAMAALQHIPLSPRCATVLLLALLGLSGFASSGLAWSGLLDVLWRWHEGMAWHTLGGHARVLVRLAGVAWLGLHAATAARRGDGIEPHRHV